MDTMDDYGNALRLRVLEAENASMRAALASSDAIVVAQLAATLAAPSWQNVSFPADWTHPVTDAVNLLAESRRAVSASTTEGSRG